MLASSKTMETPNECTEWTDFYSHAEKERNDAPAQAAQQADHPFREQLAMAEAQSDGGQQPSSGGHASV